MPVLAFDTETELIEKGTLVPRLVCMSWCKEDGKPWIMGRDTAAALFKSYLDDPRWTLVGHHAAFDFAVMIEHDPSLLAPVFRAYAEGRVRDTKVREQLLAIKDGRLKTTKLTLEALARRYLSVQLDKGEDSWRYRYGDLMHVSLRDWPEEAKDYATADAASTLGVYQKQRERAVEDDLVSPDEKDQVRAAWALHLCGCWGLRTDPVAVEKLRTSLLAEHEALHRRLDGTDVFHVTGTKKNPKRSKNMAAIKQRVSVAYEAQGLPVPLSESGAVSYAEEVLLESGDPVLEVLGEASTNEKLLSSFVPILEQGTSIPINPFWNVLVETGRTSCGGPAIQQLPRKHGVREGFVPRSGCHYTNADYDNAELKSLGQIQKSWFGRSALADALRQGRDVHLDLAAQVLGVSYEEAKRRYDAGDPVVEEHRQQMKPANFGYPGGMSAQSFVAYARGYNIQISPERGQALRDAWFNRWPEMREYFNGISALVGDGGATVTQYWSGRVRGQVGFTQCANGFFQGLTADGAKRALWEVTRRCFTVPTSALYESRVIAFMHDELLLESPADGDAEAAEELSEVMNAEMQVLIPDIPITSAPRIFKRWYKGAKSVRDEGGRLVPYEPKPEAEKVGVPA